MTAKQIIGLIGSIIVIVGSFLPIVTLPIVGGISYMFPPGGGVGDGAFVAGFALLGVFGAVMGGSLLMLLSCALAGSVFAYSMWNLLSLLDSNDDNGVIEQLVMSWVKFGTGAATIAVGLILMLVSALMAGQSRVNDGRDRTRCPQCAELIQIDARVCRYCGTASTKRLEPTIGLD